MCETRLFLEGLKGKSSLKEQRVRERRRRGRGRQFGFTVVTGGLWGDSNRHSGVGTACSSVNAMISLNGENMEEFVMLKSSQESLKDDVSFRISSQTCFLVLELTIIVVIN